MTQRSSDDIGWSAAGADGVVAAGHADAVAAGIAVLGAGGNAADAAVATILALTVTDHGQCSIGGEVPLLIYPAASGAVRALSGAGRAPRAPEAIAWYMAHGIPPRGDIKIAPVPSVVDLCTTTLQQFGTVTFAAAVAPARRLLEAAGSEPWQPKLAATLQRLVEAEQRASGSREEKLQAVSDRFYGRPGAPGDLAGALEADYLEQGGFLRRADLAAHATTIEEPVRVTYRGYTVCKCGPWTQGPMLCQALRLLEGFDLRAMGMGSADCLHAVTEAVKLAMADRDAYYGDPDFVDVPLEALLSDAYTALRRPLIDPERASLEARPGDPRGMRPLAGPGQFRPAAGGTTTCVVADRWGNVVAATPSANVENFDGGRTGVTYSNRLVSLNTTPGHPNCIAPGKRPRITLTPTLVLRDGRPALAISVAGGDLQDQATLTLLLAAVDFGLRPAEAVTAPRFATAHHQDSFNPVADRGAAFLRAGSLTVDAGIAPEAADALARRGHRVERVPGPIAHPVMLAVDPDAGAVYAAGDPAAGRHAAAL